MNVKRIILAFAIVAAPVTGFAAHPASELIATYEKASSDCRSGHFVGNDPCDVVEDTMRNLVAIGYCYRKGEWVQGKAIEPTKDTIGDCQ